MNASRCCFGRIAALLGWMLAGTPVGTAMDGVREEVVTSWQEQYRELERQIEGRASKGQGKSVDPDDVLDEHALILPADRDPLDVVLRRTEALMRDLQQMPRAPDLGNLEKRLREIKAAAAGSAARRSTAADTELRKGLYTEVCALRRQAAFSNPLLGSDRILFVARGWNGWGARVQHNQNAGWAGLVGGGIFLAEDFTSRPNIINVLKNSKVRNGKFAGNALSGGSFLSPDLSYDGKQILFAWSENPPGFCQLEWVDETAYQIFRVNVDGSELRQLTFGKWNDVDPCWLPDGRILFVSERRGGQIRCTTASKDEKNFVMHVMRADGSDVHPISWHESCEFHPSIDRNGMIVYTRWDYVDRNNCTAQHIWTCLPDGRAPRSFHGNYPLPYHTFTGWQRQYGNTFKQRPFAEFNIRAIPGSQRYLATAGPHHGQPFGCLVMIDTRLEDDNMMSQVKRITPDAAFPEAETRGPQAHKHGTAWPLSESYYLCNYYQDLYLADRFGNRELILKLSEVPCEKTDRFRLLDPIPVRARNRPPVLPKVTFQGENARSDGPQAVISVMNVYISDVPLPPGTEIKWIRINQFFPKTTKLRDQPKIGYGSESLARMSLGTVPVEEDGSAYFEAPAGKMLQFQLLDEMGMAVHSMRSHTFVHPGENLTCLGCHESKWEAPPPTPAVPMALRRAPSKITPEAGGREPINFHRLVKPLLVGKCIPCHQEKSDGLTDIANYDSPTLRKGSFYFSGEMVNKWPTAVHGGSRTILGRFGARYSTIGQALLTETHQKALTKEEFRRVVLWLDCNSNELGAYHDVEAQRRGELVWPKLDVDPIDPHSFR